MEREVVNMNSDKLFDNAGKFLNAVCNFLVNQAEGIEERRRQLLKKCSDTEIKRAYHNRNNLDGNVRKLVEEEARRRRIH